MLPTPEDLTLDGIQKHFSTDKQARNYLEAIRWPEGIVCPHCKNKDQAKFWVIEPNKDKKIRAGLRQCVPCGKQFTVTVGTIFEDSKIPLRKWLVAWYLLCASKKGISALQIQRMLGLGSYRTAWMMMHKIRHALRDPIFTDQLSGTVEVDETFIGGEVKGRGRGYRGNKAIVMSLVERGGRVRSKVIERVTGATLQKAVSEQVQPGSSVMTDDYFGYRGLKQAPYKHYVVKHLAKEYARKDTDGTVVTTNTVEGFFSLLKRGVVGTFHHISKKHLPLYLAEFDHRYNARKINDGERTVQALQKMEGKRLTYKPLRACKSAGKSNK